MKRYLSCNLRQTKTPSGGNSIAAVKFWFGAGLLAQIMGLNGSVENDPSMTAQHTDGQSGRYRFETVPRLN